jgi:C-terminal processing protease CtpA/Prc
LACLKLLTRIQDANATLNGNTQPLNEVMGKYILPFTAQFIDDKLVVTGHYKDQSNVKSNVKPGDIVEQIDGLGILDHIRKYMDITPASNYEAKLQYMVSSTGGLLRSNTKEATITIIRDGKPQNIKLNRIEVDTTMQLVDDGIAATKTTQILPGNIGYLNHGSLAKGDLAKVKEMMAGTKGLIIDMRCYSRVYVMSEYKSWLKSTNASYLRYAFMNINHPGVFDIAPAVPSYNDANENSYKGKLIVLVDSRTKGTSEFHTMMLQSIPGVKLVGSTTAGTDGNRSEVPLPGVVYTYFSGHGVLYPDATETQHKGLRIDKEVRPTIAGILAGKDEVLEAAIKMINE